jgi:AcrR family transcriptional regulator
MNHKDRRQDILIAAMELFAQKGFRGTTTRDLAARAEVNEAIIFRHFSNKEELYKAILEAKMRQGESSRSEELKQLAESGDDVQFFEALGHTFLERHEHDTNFIRLLLFSALEGHQLSDMFLDSMPERNPVAAYIQNRIEKGVFKPVDPYLAARALLGMFFMFVQSQELFGLKQKRSFDRKEVVQTFVSIFLTGIKTGSENL